MRRKRTWGLWSVLAVLPLLMGMPSCDMTDTDGDGVPDFIDQCPTEPGPVDNLGCPVVPPEAYDCDNPPALAGLVTVRNPIKDQFIVVMKPLTGRLAVSEVSVQTLASKYKVANVVPLSRGFSGTIKAQEKEGAKLLASLLRDPAVQYVSQVGRKSIPPVFQGAEPRASVTWGLDRVDQRDRPLNGVFAPSTDGAGIHVVVNDTGVTGTPDLGARLSEQCFSTIVFQGCADGHGHGTHVAGTAAGTKWGICKGCIVHSARFLDSNGSGTDADAILSLEEATKWVLADPAQRWVLNMSWGGSPAPAVDAAVCRFIQAGGVAVAAAGNETADSKTATPARIKQVITVMATDSGDKLAYFSNYGDGVDLGAPGVDIESDRPDGGTATMSGTSMASPHVVGGAALFLKLHPSATPAEVEAGLVAASSKDKLGSLPSTEPPTPNRLLFVGKE